MNKLIYSTKITLYNSFFDKNDKLSPKSVLSIFQDVASVHAEEIGLGFQAMLDKNLYWIITRIKFDILKHPTPNQVVIIETWPHEKGKIDFDRDMKISSLDGELLIIAQSKWCIIDTKTRSLQRTDNVNYNGECLNIKNYPDKFVKITPPATEAIHLFDYTVRYCDLDHNNHMNNTNYANIISSVIKDKSFDHFEINFISECIENDIINVFCVQEEFGNYVIGKNGDKTTFVSFVK